MPFYVWIIIGVVAFAIILACLLCVFLKRKKKSKPKIVINDEFINELVKNYGGLSNIKDVLVDNGRLKIEVLDFEKVNLDGIQKLSSDGGVFATGNVIKTLYKLDSKTIKEKLDKMR